MKYLAYIFSPIWRLWFLIVFIILFILLIPVLLLFTVFYKREKVVAHIARYWSKFTLLFSFLKNEIIVEEELNLNDIYIFCPNHVSTLDIPFIYAVLNHPIQFIGKSDIADIPLFGYFYKENSIIVNRKSIKNSYSAFLQAGKKLDAGLSVCIFPEGGIPDEKIFLRKFKNGPFKLALDKNIKIVPITIADNKIKFPQSYFKGSPGTLRATIHRPIDTNKLNKKTIENLNNYSYNDIFEELKKYASKQ